MIKIYHFNHKKTNNMSREIKFRAWDAAPSFGRPNRMYYDVIVGRDIVICQLDEGEAECGNLEPQYWTMDNEEGCFTIMQFTGLRDKHGKDIYEGDVVKSISHKPSVYHVEFLEGGFCMTGGGVMPIDINHFYPSVGTDLEVIGNIHETPELVNA